MELLSLAVFSLHISFISGTLVLSLALISLKDNKYLNTLNKFYKLPFFFLAISILIFIYFLLIDKFELVYIYSHSSRNLPSIYKISSLWSGGKGSVFLWICILVGVLVLGNIYFKKASNNVKLAYFILSNTLIIYHTYLLIKITPPFEIFSNFTPVDGEGLNPLLINIYMLLHPIFLYLGFAFCFLPWLLTLLLTYEKEKESVFYLINNIRKTTLLAWIMLGIGNITGMLWAYKILGWGGYWGWDPVENSSLVPWLLLTGALHLNTKRQSERYLSRVINSLVVLSVIIGIIITRTNLVSSIHSFSESEIKSPIIVFFFIILLLSIYHIVIKREAFQLHCLSNSNIKNDPQIRLLRLSGSLIPMLAGIFILAVTLSPAIINHFINRKVELSIDIYLKLLIPLVTMLLLLIIISILKLYFYPFLAKVKLYFLLVGIGLLSLLISPEFNKITTKLIFMLSFSLIIIAALATLIHWKNLSRKTTMLLILHGAIGFIFIGLSGKSLTIQSKSNLKVNSKFNFDGFNIILKSIRKEVTLDGESLIASLELKKDKNSTPLTLFPSIKNFYHNKEISVSIADVIVTPMYDLLIIPVAYKEEGFLFQFIKNPLTLWLWLGLFIIIGTTLLLIISLNPTLSCKILGVVLISITAIVIIPLATVVLLTVIILFYILSSFAS